VKKLEIPRHFAASERLTLFLRHERERNFE
jgi:hypothetical protein